MATTMLSMLSIGTRSRVMVRTSADLKLLLAGRRLQTAQPSSVHRSLLSSGFKEGATTTTTRKLLSSSCKVPSSSSATLQLMRPTVGRSFFGFLQPTLVRQNVIFRTMTQNAGGGGGGIGNEWAELSKMSIGQRLKVMIRKYWYIALPLHFVGSCAWFGGFYLLCRFGFDGAKLIAWIQPYVMQSTLVPDVVKEIFKKDPASLGALAVTALLYKLVTPLRYMTTIFGTFYTVKYLLRSGKMVKSATEISKQSAKTATNFLNHSIQKNLQKRKMAAAAKKSAGSSPKPKPPPSSPPPSSSS